MKLPSNNNRYIIKNLLLIAAIIIACALLARSLTSGETLSDYADENKFPIHSTE